MSRQREMITDEQALAFLDTNAFAQDVLAKAIAKVGRGNLGGQLEELRRRLQGYADNINNSEPMHHKRMELAASKLLAKFGLVAAKGTGHVAYADYKLTINAETVVDAIAIFESFGHHLESTYLVKKTGTTFVADCRYTEEKFGDIQETVAYWAVVGHGHDRSVRGYINSRDDANLCVEIDVRITGDAGKVTRRLEPAPRDHRGRKIGTDQWHFVDGTGYFPRSIRFWASEGTPNTFYGY